MTIEFRMLGQHDGAVLDRVADDLFDEAVRPALVREFLADSRHHLAVALDGGLVVGFASRWPRPASWVAGRHGC